MVTSRARVAFASSRLALAAGLALILAGLVGTARAAPDELMKLDTRPGVTVPFLLVRPAGQPVASVVLFAGGHGHLALSSSGIGWGQGNFLVRTRQRFADRGLLVIVVDSPSDRGTQGMWRFRSTAEHAEDTRILIAAVRRMAPVPVWLVGTSMGTVSAANAAARLRDGGPDGLVLTSSVTRPPRDQLESLADVRLKDIRVPTLIVHHRDDACASTPYQDAVALPGALTQAPRRELITMEGGQAPRSKPCEAFSAHGYLGIEDKAVAAVANWITATPP
jgi:pimeloyl-ACP methyl ester carboxylesterase